MRVPVSHSGQCGGRRAHRSRCRPRRAIPARRAKPFLRRRFQFVTPVAGSFLCSWFWNPLPGGSIPL